MQATAARHVHIIGIGGVMMSAIARLLTRQGCTVSGSDQHASELTAALGREGVVVHIGHDAAHLPPEVELVAVSAAIPENNPELLEARRRGVPVLSRAEVLGQVVNPRRGIAVAGTHGKTTTAALIATILTEAGLDPTFLVGSQLAGYGSNARVGGSDWVVVEADEYARAFLSLYPQVSLVLNVEFDHPDIYADPDDLLGAFRQFVSQTRPDGLVVLCADDPLAMSLASCATAAVATFGFSETADWRVLGDSVWQGGRMVYVVSTPTGDVEVRAPLLGRHNQLNAAAAMAAADATGIAPEEAARRIEGFRGAERRLELLGEADGVRVLSDYAHHPTEVVATIAAARDLGGRLRVVYEPHQYARTRALLRDYAGAFDGADETYICDIYRARETDLTGVSGAMLADVAGGPARRVYYVGSQEVAFQRLTADPAGEQTWLIMGAGDIHHLARRLAAWLTSR